jgi:hypothetical protein
MRCVPAVIGDCGVVQGVRVIEIEEPKLRRGVPPRGEILIEISIDEQPACKNLAKSGEVDGERRTMDLE